MAEGEWVLRAPLRPGNSVTLRFEKVPTLREIEYLKKYIGLIEDTWREDFEDAAKEATDAST